MCRVSVHRSSLVQLRAFLAGVFGCELSVREYSRGAWVADWQTLVVCSVLLPAMDEVRRCMQVPCFMFDC